MKKITFFAFGLILFIFLFNCSIRPVNALNLKYYNVESHIKEDGSVLNLITLEFNGTDEKVVYPVKYHIESFNITTKKTNITCNVVKGSTSIITCDFPHNKENTISFSFVTRENTKKTWNGFEFSYVHLVPYDSNKFFNVVYLPQGAVLSTDISNESFFPKDGRTLTDGKHIMVYWEKSNIKKGDNMYFTVNYRLPNNQSNTESNIVFIISLAVIVVVIAILVYFKTIHGRQSINVLLPILREDEKTVIEIIKKHGGEVNQKIIVRESDFSKAKVSRIISNLKERGIIEVIPMGRTNKIKLTIK